MSKYTKYVEMAEQAERAGTIQLAISWWNFAVKYALLAGNMRAANHCRTQIMRINP
jgi:hypothetical protein